MTAEHCNYRSGSIALDWGPLRENVERAGWGREPIRWRWRPNTADRRVPRRRLTSGGRGGAPLIAASWQRRAGWERPAPQPLTHRRRLTIAIIQPVLPLTVECAVVRRRSQWRRCRHSCNTSMMFRWLQSRTREWTITYWLSNAGTQWQVLISLLPGFGFWWVVISDYLDFWANSEVDHQKRIYSKCQHWIMN